MRCARIALCLSIGRGCARKHAALSQEKKQYVIVQNDALEDERTSCKFLPFVPHARGVDQIGRPDRNGGAIIKYASC